MKKGYLSDYFEGFAYKRLASVEVDPNASNEHEFNGVAKFRKLLGDSKRTIRAKIVYLTDVEDSILQNDINMTWYDAREKHETRTEFRLYYQDNNCIHAAHPGDFMIVALNSQNQLNIFIAKAGDTIENQLAWLFGIDLQSVQQGDFFKLREAPCEKSTDIFTKLILEKIGIEIKIDDPELLEIMLERFKGQFPTTFVFSEFARELSRNINISADPDKVIIEWLESEEYAFRTLEKHFVERRLEIGFSNVEAFIKYSLSVHNRRKSRAGRALENHLRFLFTELNVKYSYNKIAEHNTRPDFLFPGIEQYRNLSYCTNLLTVLGVKTSCKDRWRQVLSEAQRIPKKHLLTLEPGISTFQTDEMQGNDLQLIVPEAIRSTYTPLQQRWLLNLSEFIELVHLREK